MIQLVGMKTEETLAALSIQVNKMAAVSPNHISFPDFITTVVSVLTLYTSRDPVLGIK